MSDSKTKVLKSIKDNPKSTKALHEQFHVEFTDRAELSAFLGNMFRAGYIKKRTNGYWALLAKGEVLLQEMLDGEASASQYGAEKTSPEPATDPSPSIRGTSSLPAKPSTNEFKVWVAIQAIQSVMDEGQQLIIEGEKTYFEFASRRFVIGDEEDLAAAIRVAGMYAGVAA